MASNYDREDDRYRERRRSMRGGEYERGQGYGGSYDRGWEQGREAGRYGTGWPEDYETGYSSRYSTGDEQGRGFAGGRDFGRSYSPSFERDYGTNYGRTSERGYGDRRETSERHYEGTYRPPDYGHEYAGGRSRTYRGEGYAGDRDWFDRASDEVSSWFGDDDAERRRRMDKMRAGKYRGRGPKGYRRSDERIKEDINDRLTDHAYLDASDIDVTVKDAEVTLSGTVLDRTDKRIAEDVAESVSGVKNVQNNLRTKENERTTPNTSTTTSATARGI